MRLDDGKWTIVNEFTESEIVYAEPFPAAEINLALSGAPTRNNSVWRVS